jgi:hypothetical protein
MSALFESQAMSKSILSFEGMLEAIRHTGRHFKDNWKTENENNNTLKRQGYHLSHNFGHGQNNLSNVLATLNLLAFLCHTLLAMTNEAYQLIRKKLGARKKFFEHLRTLTHSILFPNFDALLEFIMDNLKLKLNTC